MDETNIIPIIVCCTVVLVGVLLAIIIWQRNVVAIRQMIHNEQILKILYTHDNLKIENNEEYLKACKAKETLENAEANKYKNNYELINLIVNNKDKLDDLGKPMNNDDDDVQWMYEAYKSK